jgi:hypothetical protein
MYQDPELGELSSETTYVRRMSLCSLVTKPKPDITDTFIQTWPMLTAETYQEGDKDRHGQQFQHR